MFAFSFHVGPELSTRVGCSHQRKPSDQRSLPGTTWMRTRNHGLFIMPMRFQVGQSGCVFCPSQHRTAISGVFARSSTSTSSSQSTQQ